MGVNLQKLKARNQNNIVGWAFHASTGEELEATGEELDATGEELEKNQIKPKIPTCIFCQKSYTS